MVSETKPKMKTRLRAEIDVIKKHLCLLVGLRPEELEEQIDKELNGIKWGL